MKTRKHLAVYFYLFALIAISYFSMALPGKLYAWSNDPTVNTPICTGNTDDQANPRIISDGSGGAIITWFTSDFWTSDPRFALIQAQRVDASGAVKWTANGTFIGAAMLTNSSYNTEIASDGSAGAIITWVDHRNGSADIYAQRVDASGTPQWTDNGVPICKAIDDQSWPEIISDGSGGAIITWGDERNGSDHIYAQRVDTTGAVKWTANGEAIYTGDYSTNGQITSDGSGGAIISWERYTGGYGIYAQRVDASGTPQWTDNGVAICTLDVNQYYSAITSDGSGGAIIA